MGMGDYKVKQNTISMGQSTATFLNNGDGMEVCHREFIQDITGSTLFAQTRFAINPGQAVTFPWLSGIASLFEQYEMLGLVFEYRPTSGNIVAASPALGAIIYGTQYDAYDSPFASKQEMDAYQFSTSCAPFDGMVHPVECALATRSQRKLYVRTTPSAPAGSLLSYDLGNFSFASQGMPSAYITGELWVSYHVRLSKPKLGSPSSLLTTPAVFELSYNSNNHAGATTSVFGDSTANAVAWVDSWQGVLTTGVASGTAALITPSFQTGAPVTGSTQLFYALSSNTLLLTQPGIYVVNVTQNGFNSTQEVFDMASGSVSFGGGYTITGGTNLSVTDQLSAPGFLIAPASGTVSPQTVISQCRVVVVAAGSTASNVLTWAFGGGTSNAAKQYGVVLRITADTPIDE